MRISEMARADERSSGPASGGEGSATRLLLETRGDDPRAAERLFTLVYDDLRSVAGAYLRRERAGHTLQPTALVHEAYLRLVDARDVARGDRARFLAIGARVMRQVLVDHARARGSEKRGGGWGRVTLADEPAVGPGGELEALDVEDALARLEALDPRKARVVELRVYGGMTMEETAEVLGISPKTVEADWYMARAWLRAELKGSAGDSR